MKSKKFSNFLPQEKVTGKFYPGNRIGKLTIVEFIKVDRQGRNVYECKCDCGNTIIKASSYAGIRTVSCGCWHIKKYEDIPGPYWYNVIRNAGCRQIEFDITQEEAWKIYLQQEKKCALSGEDIKIGGNASLDRIDSSKGYYKDNVHWVTAEHNKSKMDFSMDRYREMSLHVAITAAKKSKEFLNVLKEEVNKI
jgi:hypothetical protein